MILKEAIYDLYELSKYNLHVHSYNSSCARIEMTLSRIVKKAKKCDLKVVAITDHYNFRDFDIIGNNNRLKEEISNDNKEIKILYGAELSAYGVNKFLDPIEVNEKLDYRLYSYNHYHLDFWEHPRDQTPRGYVDHGLQILTSLIKSGRADCIAHPFIGRFINCLADKTPVTREMRDRELGDILELGKKHNVAWEINTNAFLADSEFAKRYWEIGKEVGVTFHMGTDAHRLEDIDPRQVVDKLMLILK